MGELFGKETITGKPLRELSLNICVPLCEWILRLGDP
jgi:hypothetical protein